MRNKALWERYYAERAGPKGRRRRWPERKPRVRSAVVSRRSTDKPPDRVKPDAKHLAAVQRRITHAAAVLLLGAAAAWSLPDRPAPMEEPTAQEEALRDALRVQPVPSPHVRPMPRFPVEGVPPQGRLAGTESERRPLSATQWVWLSALAATVVLLFVELRRVLDRK